MARNQHPQLTEFTSTGKKVPLVFASVLDCAMVVVVSAVCRLTGEAAAKKALNCALNSHLHLKNLKQMRLIVTKLGMKLSVRRPTNQKWILEHRFDGPFCWLGGSTSKVFIVRLM